MTIKIKNRQARRHWLNSQGLASTPTGTLDALQIIKDLGFVQLDTIQNVTRAHHHIIWSRNQNYREPMLDELLAKDSSLFEHFTHDASVLPMEFYPMWRRQFKRMERRVNKSNYYRAGKNDDVQRVVKDRITEEGPLSTHAFDTKIVGEKKMWSRPPHKLALDHMWYSGELATSHRENFKKFYDLAERVVPAEIYAQNHADDVQLDWLCRAALDRLGFATIGEIQKFWDAADLSEVKDWINRNQNDLQIVELQGADGSWTEAYAFADFEDRLDTESSVSSRLRIISPFDPAVRDRVRLSRLFGFDYKIEIFVPAAKRKWGYYVYPLLEGDRFVGRIEVKADRKAGFLSVENLWQETGVRWTGGRQNKLDAELERLGRFIGVREIKWVNSSVT
ncbi:hypothetical protein A9Q83_06360 [Alphaproteobacteria bacterium 46_93_T64]|nr:hypothetical protein A9Q83_06360 [Alphaproteobacteria bacterium 46_93_T64]